MVVLQQILLYEIIRGILPMCHNTTIGVNGAWIKRYCVLCSKTYNTLHSCHNFPAGSLQATRGAHICETSLLDVLTTWAKGMSCIKLGFISLIRWRHSLCNTQSLVSIIIISTCANFCGMFQAWIDMKIVLHLSSGCPLNAVFLQQLQISCSWNKICILNQVKIHWCI